MRHRTCLAIDLRDDADAIAEYDRIHAPGNIWPEVIVDLRARGYKGVTIWRTGNRLFMIVEIESVSTPRHDEAVEAVLARWQALTQSLQQALPGMGDPPHWVTMNCVFDLNEHH